MSRRELDREEVGMLMITNDVLTADLCAAKVQLLVILVLQKNEMTSRL